MKKTEQKMLNTIEKAGKFAAIVSAGCASLYCFHQPKEPLKLKKMLCNKK